MRGTKTFIERMESADRINELDRLLKERDALKSEVERLKVELKEAQAAAAVMRSALEYCKDFVQPHVTLFQLFKVEVALSTTAGTAFLARMAEAEWLVEHSGESMEWVDRCSAFLKGEGVKA